MSSTNNHPLSLANRISQYLAHRRDRSLLLRLDDRTLADINVSRELLEAGVKAWPWKLAADQQGAHAARIPAIHAAVYGRADVATPVNDNDLAKAA